MNSFVISVFELSNHALEYTVLIIFLFFFFWFCSWFSSSAWNFLDLLPSPLLHPSFLLNYDEGFCSVILHII